MCFVTRSCTWLDHVHDGGSVGILGLETKNSVAMMMIM